MMGPAEPGPSAGARILDVGCGKRKYPGATGLDLIALPGVDIVHDLNVVPWPILDGQYEYIICKHSLSHVRDLIPVLREIHRVAAPGAIVDIYAPHYTSDNYWSDPTHRVHFGYRSMNYFAANVDYRWNFYTTERFAIVRRHLSFGRHAIANVRGASINPFRLLGVEALVNAAPRIYERFFAFILPVAEVHFRLQVVKP